MLIPLSFGQMISSLREQRGQTRTQLARLVGVDRRRISEIERDSVPPDELILALAGALEAQPHSLLNAARDLRAARKGLLANGSRFERCFGKRRSFFPHQDRDNRIRLAAALKHYPRRVRAIIGRLKRRKDFPMIQHFLRLVCTESRLEFLFVLLLLDWGAQPLLAAPTESGAAQLRLVDPADRSFVGHRRFPGMGIRYRGVAMLVYPQVNFDGDKERPRVDFLFCLPQGSQFAAGTAGVCALNPATDRKSSQHRLSGVPFQVVVETDGADKQPAPDRDRLIGLEIIRLGEQDLLTPEFVTGLLERICKGSAAGTARANPK